MKTSLKTSWEANYRQSGRLWRGKTRFLPKEFKPGSKVLELGCGNGKTAAALSVLPIKLHAIDFSKTAAMLCRKSVNEAGGKADIREMDGKKLSYPDCYFDAVLCFHYLAHFDAAGRKKAADEAVRVLNKSGKIYFRDFGVGDFRFGKGKALKEKRTFSRNGIITHYFTEKEAKGLFHGLRLENSKSENWKMRKFKRQEIWAELSKGD